LSSKLAMAMASALSSRGGYFYGLSTEVRFKQTAIAIAELVQALSA